MTHENQPKNLDRVTTSLRRKKDVKDLDLTVEKFIRDFDPSNFKNINLEQVKIFNEFLDSSKLEPTNLIRYQSELTNHFFDIISEQQNYRLDDKTKEYFKQYFDKTINYISEKQKNNDLRYEDSNIFEITFPNALTVNGYEITPKMNSYFIPKVLESDMLRSPKRIYNLYINKAIDNFCKEIINPNGSYDQEKIEKYRKNIEKLLDFGNKALPLLKTDAFNNAIKILGIERKSDNQIEKLINEKPFNLKAIINILASMENKDQISEIITNLGNIICTDNFKYQRNEKGDLLIDRNPDNFYTVNPTNYFLDDKRFENLNYQDIKSFIEFIDTINDPNLSGFIADGILTIYWEKNKYHLENEEKNFFRDHIDKMTATISTNTMIVHDYNYNVISNIDFPNQNYILDFYAHSIEAFCQEITNPNGTINKEKATIYKSNFESFIMGHSYQIFYVLRQNPNMIKTVSKLIKEYSYNIK